VKRLLPAMLFPLAWMALQAVPLPFDSLVNPIWPSASAALNEPSLWGCISIDPGSAFRSLIAYAVMLSLMVATIIVARDRQRAETVLFVLSAVTVFMSAEVLVNKLNSLAGIVPAAGAAGATTFVAAGALGSIANTATVTRAIERYQSRRELSSSSVTSLVFGLFLGVAGIAICLAAMWTLAPRNVLIATTFGLAIMLFIIIARRLTFYLRTLAIILAIFTMLATAIMVERFQNNLILGFAASVPAESLALAQRTLSDSRWLGSGAGTFGVLAGTYQDFGAPPISGAPTTVALIAIEWGWAALFILAGFAIQLFVFTFRGAIRRGRDSFFPAAAAAGTAVVFCEAFCDSSLTHPAVQIITVVVIGLGISQSAGRTSSF
jgi:hypothetical protein